MMPELDGAFLEVKSSLVKKYNNIGPEIENDNLFHDNENSTIKLTYYTPDMLLEPYIYKLFVKIMTRVEEKLG
jgi:hypothetical protein